MVEIDIKVLPMSPVHVLPMSPVHVLPMSPVYVLPMSPVYTDAHPHRGDRLRYLDAASLQGGKTILFRQLLANYLAYYQQYGDFWYNIAQKADGE